MPSYLLVDGYNVAHAWPTLAPLMRGDPERAAVQLVERLRVLHDSEGCAVTVVFDGKGLRPEKSPLQNPGELCVLYSPTGSSADALIEQMVFRAPDPSCFTVASRDNMVRTSVLHSGGRAITPAELLEWVEAAERRRTLDILERNRRESRKFGNRLF